MDASTRQRLIRYVANDLSASGAKDYTPLRRFSNTGDYKYLSKLEFTHVQQAIRAAKSKNGSSDPGSNGAGAQTSDAVASAIRDPAFEETGFLDQVRDLTDDQDVQILVGEVRIADWNQENLEVVQGFFSDPDAGLGYPSQAGSVELIPDADPFPRPGGGTTEWRSLLDIGEKVQTLRSEPFDPI